MGEMFNVAEAIIRVYHRLGDYKHKARNRLKFLVRSLGWDGFKAEFERELEAFRAEGGAPLPFEPEAPSEEPPPRGTAIAKRRRRFRLRRVPLRHPSSDQASCRRSSRISSSTPLSSRGGRSATSSRRSKPDGLRSSSRTLLGDLTTAQMHLIGELSEGIRRRHRARDTRPELRDPLGPNGPGSRAVSQPARSRPRAGRCGDARRRDQLPRRRVVQAGGHAVARPRAPARRRPLRAVRIWCAKCRD